MPLREPQLPAKAPVQTVNQLVRVPRAETTENDAPSVRLAGAFGVAEVQQLRALSDIESTIAKFDASRHEQALDELGELVRAAIAIRVLAYQHIVVGLLAWLDLRIAHRAGDP